MPWSQDVTGYRSGCHENPELDMDERNWINGPARQNYTQWAVGVKDLQAHAGRSMWPRSSHQSSRPAESLRSSFTKTGRISWRSCGPSAFRRAPSGVMGHPRGFGFGRRLTPLLAKHPTFRHAPCRIGRDLVVFPESDRLAGVTTINLVAKLPESKSLPLQLAPTLHAL